MIALVFNFSNAYYGCSEFEMAVRSTFLKYFISLQLAGILLDTENLDFASMRDMEMTAMLDLGSRSLGRTGFFNQCKFMSCLFNIITSSDAWCYCFSIFRFF